MPSYNPARGKHARTPADPSAASAEDAAGVRSRTTLPTPSLPPARLLHRDSCQAVACRQRWTSTSESLGRRALVGRVAGREDVGTLVVRGTGPAGRPGTGRLYFSFGASIQTTCWVGREDDPEALGNCRDLVRAAVERQIEQLLALREEDPGRRLLPPASEAVRDLLPAARSVRGLLDVLP